MQCLEAHCCTWVLLVSQEAKHFQTFVISDLKKKMNMSFTSQGSQKTSHGDDS